LGLLVFVFAYSKPSDIRQNVLRKFIEPSIEPHIGGALYSISMTAEK